MNFCVQHPIDDETGEPQLDRFYVELQADGNNETLMTSEVYESHEAAVHMIHLVTQASEAKAFTVTDRTVV